MDEKKHNGKSTEQHIEKDDEMPDDGLLEFAILKPESLGLPFAVYVCTKSGRDHDVHVKFSHRPDFAIELTAIIGLRPEIQWLSGMRLNRKDFDLVRQWIELNYETIMAYWDGEVIYSADLLDAIRSL